MTTINEKSQVLMHMLLKLEDGSVADSTREVGQPAKVFLGNGSLSQKFESSLYGLKAGDTHSFTLDPQDSFGESNPDNIQHMDLSQFGAEIPVEVGTIVAFTDMEGKEIPGMIAEIAGDSVTVDFNHPLAGKRVTFEVEILSVE